MRYFLIILCCVILSACGSQHSDTLVIGLIKPSMNHLPVQYAIKIDNFPSGKYKIEYFHSGWETNEALVAGKIDLAIMPFTYAWMDVSQNKKVKIVSFLERESDGIIADTKFSKLQDLTGSKMGVLKNSTLEIIPEMIFDAAGLQLPDMIPFRTPMDMAAALRSGEVDAISYYVPSIFKLEDKFRIVDWYSTSYPVHPCCDLIAGEKALGSKAVQIRNFVKLMDETVVMMKNNRDKMCEIARDGFDLSQEIAWRSLTHTKYQMGLEEAGKEFESQAARLMLSKGYLEREVSADEVYHRIYP